MKIKKYVWVWLYTTDGCTPLGAPAVVRAKAKPDENGELCLTRKQVMDAAKRLCCNWMTVRSHSHVYTTAPKTGVYDLKGGY